MKLITASGREIDPQYPQVSDIDLEDIAYGLAKEERFDGNTLVPYTVAQHSVHVANLIASGWDDCEISPKLVAAGLLHDATEAYLGDMVTPLKRALPDYRNLENHWHLVICERFGLEPCLAHGMTVKTADDALFQIEALCLTRRCEQYGVNRGRAGELLDQVNKQYADIGHVLMPYVWDRHLSAIKFLDTAKLLDIK